jgi:hypothetical protein
LPAIVRPSRDAATLDDAFSFEVNVKQHVSPLFHLSLPAYTTFTFHNGAHVTQPPYYPQYAQPGSTRPTSVSVLAVLGIIFGAIGVLCSPMALVPYYVNFGPPNPVIDTVKNSPPLFTWTVGGTVLGFILGIVLLSGSIGAWSLKPWARKLLVLYGWAALVLGIFNTLIMTLVVMPKASAGATSGMAHTQATAGMIGGIVGGVLALALPLCMIIFMTRPHVKEAFENAAEPNLPPQPQYSPPPPGTPPVI